MSISTLRALSHLTIRLSNSTPQRRRTHWHCSLLSKRTRTPSYLSKKNQCSTHESMLSQLNRAARVTRLVACSRRASTRRASTTGASSQEWKAAGLGAQWAPPDTALTEIVFVQAGMGCDQHGAAGASKAATRACRQAIEFNALPYMETLMRDRGYEGRADMLLKVEIGVPEDLVDSVSVEDIRAMFPYGRMLPVQVRAGGLDFPSGRVVEALGDNADRAVVAVAAVTVGF